MFHRFRLTKQDDYFWVDFDHFWIEQYIWRQLRPYWKLAQAENRTTIGKFSLPKSVRHSLGLNGTWLSNILPKFLFWRDLSLTDRYPNWLWRPFSHSFSVLSELKMYFLHKTWSQFHKHFTAAFFTQISFAVSYFYGLAM